MKKLIKTTLPQLLAGILFLLLIPTLFSNCNKPSTDDTGVNTSETALYIGYSQCDETHIIGTSPCPQLVCNNRVYCFAANKFTDCTADSAVITNHHPGLICTFKNNGKFSSPLPTDGSGEEMEVLFSCSIAETIIHTYDVEIYKNGKVIKVEKFKVSVTVK